ncbi:quinolinate synthase NadA [bacterium]|nr:MAG: quinolinate synthase NadA [bacterium]
MSSEENIQKQIRLLARERNAVILAHNYQRGEVQDVADHTGDSLGLSIIASKTDAKVIVFCGVHFMAESASILSPEKTVLLPRLDAGCPMADMITAEDLIKVREEHPGVPIVTYVNSSAKVKAVSDICCTSANAVKVTNSLPEKTVYLAPDRNLARWVARNTDKNVLYWNGCCPSHERLTARDVLAAKAENPGAPFIAHPECRPEVIDLADAVRSTSGMLEWCKNSSAKTIIVGTETGLFHQLRKNSPDKTFVAPTEKLFCPNMKLTSLEDLLVSLEKMENVIEVEESVRIPAARALQRMVDAGRD